MSLALSHVNGSFIPSYFFSLSIYSITLYYSCYTENSAALLNLLVLTVFQMPLLDFLVI